MYKRSTTKHFDKSLRKCAKQGLDLELLKTAIKELETNGCLSAQYRPHKLHGKLEGTWECHIKGDWLLLWKQDDNELTLLLVDTGSHSELYDHK